jgi:SAM-dependent methyltransferase
MEELKMNQSQRTAERKQGEYYNQLHATWANQRLNVKDKKVLVVGCNTGYDCSYFVDFGANLVFGIDIIYEVVKAYKNSKVEYFKMSAESMCFIDNQFDLVYCFATMEHILNIDAAFSEMVRVTRGGV